MKIKIGESLGQQHRTRSRPRSTAARPCRGRRRGHGRRERRVLGGTSASRRRSAGRTGRHLVRGARVQRRHRRAQGRCATRCAAMSPPASTPLTCTTQRHWPQSWTASNSTRPAAVGTPGGSSAPPLPRPTTCRCPPTVRRRSTRRSPPQCRICATSNGSPTTPGSNQRLVDGSPQPRGGMIEPNRAEPGHGMTLRRDVETRRRGGSTEARTVAAG